MSESESLADCDHHCWQLEIAMIIVRRRTAGDVAALGSPVPRISAWPSRATNVSDSLPSSVPAVFQVCKFRVCDRSFEGRSITGSCGASEQGFTESRPQSSPCDGQAAAAGLLLSGQYLGVGAPADIRWSPATTTTTIAAAAGGSGCCCGESPGQARPDDDDYLVAQV